MKMAINARILLWILFIVISLALIAPNLDPNGVKVTFVEKTSVADVSVGDVIFSIDDEPATLQNIKNNYFDIVKLDTNKGTKFVRVNGSLGISAENVQPTNLNLGLDLKGGVRAVVLPNSSDDRVIEQIISTLNTRINVFGLRESVLRPISINDQKFVEITIAGGSVEELTDLLETQGVFKAKIDVLLNINNNKSVLRLDQDYELFVNEDTLTVESNNYELGEEFELENTIFVYNSAGSKLNLTATVFTGSDIKTVFFDPQRSRIDFDGSVYRWIFSIQLAPEGAERFAKVTKNLGVQPGGSLDSPIDLFLDSELIDSLSISSTLKGRVETEIQISGPAPDLETAEIEKSRLQSILRSGALPVSIKIVQLDSVSPNLGGGFLVAAALAALGAIAGVAIVVFIRYRSIKYVVPMLLVSLSEVLIILGLSVAIGWTIDLAAIGGIIAAVGTGIDSQIMILDQTLRGEFRDLSLKERLRRAFFIIFGSGGTMIAAMLPLTFIGFGALRGFAIVTILGVLIGILITRPAFGKIVETLSRRDAA